MREKGTGKEKDICEVLKRLLPKEEKKSGIIDGVDVFRVEESRENVPLCYERGIIFIVQGKKQIHLGDSIMVYDPMHYLVLSVPLPVECDTIASKEEPLLGITIHVDAAMISDILIAADIAAENKKALSPGIYAAQMDEHLSDALYRLAETLLSSSERKVLAPMYVREIVFRILNNENGEALRMLAYRNQTFFTIEHILEKIHDRYEQKYDVNTLAREADMSVSSFHAAFKSITNVSPLQYIKKMKLHKARELIVKEGMTASTAAFEVGYESTSQFTREYKRMFGITPGSESILKDY